MGSVIFVPERAMILSAISTTVTTCADGTTEHREDEGVGVNICCSSTSALCHTRNNDGKSLNSPVVPLYQRDIQSGKSVSLERSDFEEQQENSRKQGEKEDGILSYDSPCDDGDMVTFHLWNERLIRYNFNSC